MKEQVFELTTAELKQIAGVLQDKITEGLKADRQEIAAIPTHINPAKNIPDGKILALDWGGTNFRAAIVEFKNGKATILDSLKAPLSKDETKGLEPDGLYEKMAKVISQLKALDETVTRIGYCFSYPAACRLNGDAVLLRWTKGIDIPAMIEKPVGEPLLKYLNNHKDIKTKIESIKVLNDTVACLFAGLEESGYDSYIGLIVGTGTNMAGLMPLNKIDKLKSSEAKAIPVNLESGNFNPPYLTVLDGLVDALSNNKGFQRFEKAISGGYLGELFKAAFMEQKIKYNFDGGDLSHVINNPTQYPEKQVKMANAIQERSAKLVAASLAGLTQVLIAQNPAVKKIGLAADGSVFWNEDAQKQYDYKKVVVETLQQLLPKEVTITVLTKLNEPNLIGSAIAALS
ncbi:MAG: hexokinase [Prevotellaceae bacterium]|jgi:hexokinase|nr:hexokinase [Prevotellaceae bacterium]